MNPSFGPILSQLCGVDERAFERALQALNHKWAGVGDAARLADLLTVLRGLSEDSGLGPTEVTRRVRIAVDAARLPERQSRDLASSLANLPSTIRQAVTTSLPPPLRRLVYAPQPAASATPQTLTGTPRPNEQSNPPQDAPSTALPRERRECASVVLLGTFADHEENILFLKRKGFIPLRATTSQQFDEYLDQDVCGVVVARSWWPGIPESEREDVLKKILNHSSFTWLKFDAQDLPCSAERFHELLNLARHLTPNMDECGCQDGWRLTEHDTLALERIREVLANDHAVRLHPAEIQESQARVLIGAAIKHVRQRNVSGPFRFTRVEANLIPGGRSYAKIIRMAPDDGGAALVAKVDEVSRLHDEMDRFKRYALKWDTELNPKLHFHAGTSLIIFGLVESPGSLGRPAPTLEETLETLFYCEHYPDAYQGPDENDLRELINRSIAKLGRLNACRNDATCAPKTFLKCEPYETLCSIGMDWTIRPCDGSGGSVFEFITTARSRVATLADRAVVHGDVQLRNILVRDGREPHFIDYANCGPGHPSFDLVRLESAVLFFCFRMNGDERDLAALLLDILKGHDEAAVRATHPTFCTSRTNRLAIYTCISCRAAALETIAAYGGNEEDYLAMKYVVGCQSLFLTHLQAGVVRSQLSALGAYLRGRPAWQEALGFVPNPSAE